jgi:NADH-quinone oxidoreductase subunit L
MTLYSLACIAAFTPLAGAILAGLLGWKLGRTFAHSVAIGSVAISFAASCAALWRKSSTGKN